MAPPLSIPGLPDNYTAKFFVSDVVSKISDPEYRGKVIRGWTDEDSPIDPFFGNAPLKRGEVIVCQLQNGLIEVLSEMSLHLYERFFVKGEMVKHSLTDAESAVVVKVMTECRLEHVISHEVPPRNGGWVPWSKLKNSVSIEAKDKVVYDEWIGTVEEVFEDGLVEEVKSGSAYRIAEMGGLLECGRFVSEVLPEEEDIAFRQLIMFPPGADLSRDRVINVRPLILFIVWNAINQTLPISEHDLHPEPKNFWIGSEIELLTHFDSMKHQAPPLGTTVVFREEREDISFGVRPTFHLNRTFTLRTLKIMENRTKLLLRWQDGTETEEWAIGLVPYHNIDDYEAWPGEHTVWRSDTGRRPAVVQTYDPRQRVAELLLLDTKEKETVSVLELDTGGYGRASYGVNFGQFVLFCDDNGSPCPEVPSLGQVELPPHEQQLGYRERLQQLGLEYGQNLESAHPRLPLGNPAGVDWWGEVTDMFLDGTIEVELYSGQRKRVDIKNVVILNEPEGHFPGEEEEQMLEQNEVDIKSDLSWETMSGDEDDEDSMGLLSDDERFGPVEQDEIQDNFDDLMDIDESGQFEAGAGGLSPWTFPTNRSVVVETSYPTQDKGNDVDLTGANSADDEDARDAEAVEPIVSESPVMDSTVPSQIGSDSQSEFKLGRKSLLESIEAGPSSQSGPSKINVTSLAEDAKWGRFDMLEQAPVEHHYYSEPRQSAPSKGYNSRLIKEHRALESSLPENILVRTYEDRTDLMRVLIVGPEGTPYADAPFVFDVYLNPTKFPHEPPQVYFHSHTNGLGRCNPNLYEEGKVCLSILGTWSGEKSESWSPTKSSLLQVFVSISGLVLVRSPYHCEPAFAKLEGTREGRVNSRLYSEKAYVLSRSFVRSALERPPAGLIEEIRYFYLTRGRLASVIEHARRLIDKGEAEAAASGKDKEAGIITEDEENAEMWNADAVGSLTMGAILTLKRTIVALEKILEKELGTGV